MDFSLRNQKIAESRWRKTIDREKYYFLETKEAKILKSLLCGMLCGDGSVQVRKEKQYSHYQLDFFPDDKRMAEVYCLILQRVYNKQPTVKKEKSYFSVRLTSRSVVEDLLQITSYGIKAWRVPSSLFFTDVNKKAWLQGFFSAEAYVSAKQIKLQTVNEEGMRQVSQLLTEIGIRHKFYLYIPKLPNCSPVYIIMINSKEDRKRFYAEVGFCHTKKMNQLRKSLGL